MLQFSLRTLKKYSLGFWLSSFANFIAVCGGAIFLLAGPGARFRGMEPEAIGFLILTLSAVVLGLCAIPFAFVDCFRKRFRISGLVGMVLALTPYFAARGMAELVGMFLGINYDS
jgi:hypothetical protein